GVVDDGPALELDAVGVLVDDDAVARLPGGRLGDVGQHDVGDAGVVDLDDHLDLAVVRGAAGVVRHRQGLVRGAVGDGERLEEVIDLVLRDGQAQAPIGVGGVALVVGDALAVDDDASEGGVVGVDVGRVCAAAGGEGGEGGDGGEASQGVHGVSLRALFARWSAASAAGSTPREPLWSTALEIFVRSLHRTCQR